MKGRQPLAWLRTLLRVALALSTFGGETWAALVTLKINGNVTSVDQTSSSTGTPPASPGDAIAIAATYDPATAPTEIGNAFYGGTSAIYGTLAGATASLTLGPTTYDFTENASGYTNYRYAGGGCQGWLSYGIFGSLVLSAQATRATGIEQADLQLEIFFAPNSGPNPPLLFSNDLPASLADFNLSEVPEQDAYSSCGPSASLFRSVSMINGWRINSRLDITSLNVSPADAPISTPLPFSDDFNRPDGTVGNGWLNTFGNSGGDLVLRNGTLTTPGANGAAGVYRLIDLSKPVTASATFTQMNGFGGVLRRYDEGFLFGGDGNRGSGLGVFFTRGDQNYNDSSVLLTLNGAQLGRVLSTFQYGASITPTVTFDPATGTVKGAVTGDGNTFPFDFGPRTVALPGSAFGINLAFPDGRSSVITNPTVDDFSLTAPAGVVPQLIVIVILAKVPGVEPDPRHSPEYFANTLFPQVAQYHRDNSYGQIQLSLKEIRSDQQRYFELSGLPSPLNGAEQQFVTAAIQKACNGEWCDGADIVVVVHSGSSIQAAQTFKISPSDNTDLMTTEAQAGPSRPGRVAILVGETDPLGFWAHEVGHAAGVFRRTTQQGYRQESRLTPHPMPQEIYAWDLMAAGFIGSTEDPCDFSVKGNVCPALGNKPTFMSSLTRQFLGLLVYDEKQGSDLLGTTLAVKNLANSKLADSIVKIDLDRDSCYVLEARAKTSWDTSIPLARSVDSALVLYHITGPYASSGSLPPDKCSDLGYVADGVPIQKFNLAAKLGPVDSNLPAAYCDWWPNTSGPVRIAVVDGDPRSEVTVKVDKARIKDCTPELTALFDVFKGLVVRGSAIDGVQNALPEAPIPLLNVPLPDIDLHVYTDDGRHVGMNYTTGAYENQIAGSSTTGDQFNGQESIVVPDSTPNAHFVVSTLRTAQFLQLFPDLQIRLGSSNTIELVGFAASQSGDPVYTGRSSVNVPTGGFLELQLAVDRTSDGSVAVSVERVGVTISSLLAELEAFYAVGAIKTADAFRGLRDKLISARSALQTGRPSVAIRVLRAFKNQLEADELVAHYARQPLLADTKILVDSLGGD